MIIKAEWPGYVMEVLVKPGQDVEEDEPLFLMETADNQHSSFYINSPEGGRVKEILVDEGDYMNEDDDMLTMGESDHE